MFTMFTSSLTLSALALTLMQSFAAAAPGYPVGNLTTPLYPTSSGVPHPPPSVTSSLPTYPTISPVTNRTTAVVPPPYHTATTITSVLTHTKTLSWTVHVPCTTTVHGSTSYYSTASVYTTCIPEYETMTVTETCGENCYKPGPTPTSVYVPLGHISSAPGSADPAPTVSSILGNTKPTSVASPVYPVTSIIENSVTSKPTTVSVSNPVYTLPPAYTCPPVATVTISAAKTVVVTESYKTITVTDTAKTITVTDAAKTVTVTANPVASSAPPHGDCKPGMGCHTYTSSGSWNSTMTKPTYHRTGTITIIPTSAYH